MPSSFSSIVIDILRFKVGDSDGEVPRDYLKLAVLPSIVVPMLPILSMPIGRAAGDNMSAPDWMEPRCSDVSKYYCYN